MSCALVCCVALFGSIAFATSGLETAQTTIEAEVTTTQTSENVQSVTVDESVETEQVQKVETDEQTTRAQVVVTTQEETITQEVEQETTDAIVQVSETVEDVTTEITEEDVVEEEQDIQDSIITVEKEETEVELDSQVVETVVESVLDEVLDVVKGDTSETLATVTQDSNENLLLAETNSSTPSKVTSLKFSQSHNDEVTIYWPSASNATGYEVYVSADGGATFTLHQKTSDTSYVCSDLNSTTDYQFKIVAYNGTVYGEYSNVFSYTIETTNGIYNITAIDVTDTTATITWDAVDGATYKIEQKSTYTWSTVATGVTNNYYDLTGLTAGSDVTIRVSAKLTGSSSYGSTVEFSFITVVGTVSLSVDSAETDEIAFSWSSVTGATAYEVYVAIDGGDFALVETKTSTNYTLDRDENYTYEIKVRAIDTSGDETVYGAYSEIIKVAGLLAQVENVDYTASVDEDGNNVFTLTWDAVEGAAKYSVYTYNSSANLSSTTSYWYSLGTTTSTSWEHELSISTETSRVYKVVAVDDQGIPGIMSDVVMATTGSLDISFSTSTTTISWPTVSGATSYVVSMKSLDGKTWTELLTVTSNSATLYLAADSIVTLRVLAYNGSTSIAYAASQFQVATPELYLFTPTDSNSIAYASLGSELIYFTQVINNTKYYEGDVILESESTFSMTASDFKINDADASDVFDEFYEDFGDVEIESNTYSFSNGSATTDNGRTIDLSSSFVPFENDAYLYDSQGNLSDAKSWFEEMTTHYNKDTHYITENSDGTYSITLTISKEQNKSDYHEGFTTVFGNDDLGEEGFEITNTIYGETIINATFTDDGLLLTLEVVSPFEYSATASFLGNDSLTVELSMKISGTTTYKYTFTY